MKLVLGTFLTKCRVLLDVGKPVETGFFFAVQHPKNLSARFERA